MNYNNALQQCATRESNDVDSCVPRTLNHPISIAQPDCRYDRQLTGVSKASPQLTGILIVIRFSSNTALEAEISPGNNRGYHSFSSLRSRCVDEMQHQVYPKMTMVFPEATETIGVAFPPYSCSSNVASLARFLFSIVGGTTVPTIPNVQSPRIIVNLLFITSFFSDTLEEVNAHHEIIPVVCFFNLHLIRWVRQPE
jgi:hypothetical protein